MKIALISDIHGNFVALQAVLRDIENAQVDRVICLGDVATLGPQPREVVTRLRELNYPCIIGNHENGLLDPSLNKKSLWLETFAWCNQQLTDADRDYLRAFQPCLEVPLDERHNLLCMHGSPRDNIDLIFPTTSDDELKTMLNGHTATVMAGGHTHVQMLRRFEGMTIINVGSVGIPFRHALPSATEVRFLPHAEYAILTWVNGLLNVDFRHVPVDFEALQAASRNSTNPFNWMPYWFTPDAV